VFKVHHFNGHHTARFLVYCFVYPSKGPARW
jgi:hypothetical protein